MIYKDPKSTRTLQVDESEAVRRSILESAGWRVQNAQDAQETAVQPTVTTSSPEHTQKAVVPNGEPTEANHDEPLSPNVDTNPLAGLFADEDPKAKKVKK